MVVETWLTPQNDHKTWVTGCMKTNYIHTTTGSAQNIWGPYMVKFWHFPYLKSHSTYEISLLLKIKPLFTCLIVSSRLEAPKTNNSGGESYKFEFHLEGIYNSAEDCNISYETYTVSRPQSWERFFNILFPHRTKSVNIQRKRDTIFQIIHYFIHNEKKHNPFHVGLAELFHDDSRVKLVTEILN